MKILLVSSEVAPFAKTGGLADVAGSLPKALIKLGHEVRIVLPYYQMVKKGGFETKEIKRGLKVNISNKEIYFDLYETTASGLDKVYLIKNDAYFDREELYGTPKGAYEDNAERFTFFCKAVLSINKHLNFKPDIIHNNDWQTGLIPLYLKSIYKDDVFYKGTKTIFTLHNLAYQGRFWHYDMHIIGLGWEYFHPDGIEFYGDISFLKAGIVYSELITTVSPTYSKEIQTPEYGHGMEGILRHRSKDLYGILNGIDYDFFNPATDKNIVANYDINTIEKKAADKNALQKEHNLPLKDVPILSMITRLDDQKGLDLVTAIMDWLMKQDLQFILLGTGHMKYHLILNEIAQKYPNKTGINITYDPKLAQRIYAGSDIFIMPSRYEPCGLGQLISLRYGTIPIVRQTGGLADTIVNYSENLKTSNGFSFLNYTKDALIATIQNSLGVYRNKKEWNLLVKQGISQDFSWDQSACEYVKIYTLALGIK
ncbi:MAG: glycogen synthase GlgA [bacterium]